MKHLLRLLTVCCALCASHLVSAELLPYPIDTINGQAVYKYRVPRSIGIYRVSVNFGVTQEDIIRWNPQLKERGLHYDELIYVPVVGIETAAVAVAPDTVPATAAVDTIPLVADPVQVVDTVIVVDTVPAAVVDTNATDSFPKMKIALLLPLQAESVQRDANMERFMDFYEGCLIALYDLQYADHFDLHVFDIGKQDTEVKRLLADSVLHQMDAVIGPAYPSQVEPIARLAKEDSVLVLIPFTDHVPELQTNPYLMQFNPTPQLEAKTMADYIEANKERVNCVFVDSPEQPEGIRALLGELSARAIPSTKVPMHRILADSISHCLKDSVENILFFNTEKYSSLQIILPHVLTGKGDHRVTLYSRYSWQKEKIILPQIYTSVFATESEVDLSHYDAVYARFFKHEHNSANPRFDLLGYDLMRQLVAHLQGKEYYGLQSDIRFERVSETGGLINNHVQVIRK